MKNSASTAKRTTNVLFLWRLLPVIPDQRIASRFHASPNLFRPDIDLLKVLADAGITFGASVSVVGGDNNDVIVRADGEDASISLDLDVANAIVVKRASAL